MDERFYKIGETFESKGEEDTCRSCGSSKTSLHVYEYPAFHPVTQELGGYDRPRDQRYTIEQVMILCDFCASTFCSKSVAYPKQIDPNIARVMGIIAFSHNALMSEIRKLIKRPEDAPR